MEVEKIQKILRMEKVPDKLRYIKYPPKELFYQGDLNFLEKPKVAIIGTRKPNQYSRRVTYSLANQLSKNGFIVVSGGALGTDITAHKGAFPNTISIMANSLDIIYPKTNWELIKKMSIDSLLISESEKETPAHPKRFIHRNRLIVGLSDIVVVIEADKNSGSSQTMRIAKESGKEIYVLPHHIDESLATNEYLEKGYAKAIYSVDNFIENMRLKFKIEKTVLENNIELDEFSLFCKTSPTYEEAFKRFGDILFEKELNGEIEIVNGVIILQS